MYEEMEKKNCTGSSDWFIGNRKYWLMKKADYVAST